MIITTLMSLYLATATVRTTAPTTETTVVEAECKDGNIYAFDGEGFKMGDNITLFMNGKGTADPTDDEIVGVF